MNLPLRAPCRAGRSGDDLLLREPWNGRSYRLNPVAGMIWQLCDGGRDAATIASLVAARFDRRVEDIADDVESTLDQLRTNGLIEPRGRGAREHALVLACLRAWFAPEETIDIERLSIEEIEWRHFTQTAVRQRVVPAVYLFLRRHLRHRAPSGVLADFRQAYLASARRNRLLLRELLALLDDFASHGIPALTLKGPVLAEMLYGSVAMRQFSDLDIFVPPAFIQQAGERLVARGYRQGESHDVESTWTREDGMVGVDLQWALAPDRLQSPIQLDQLWESLEPVNVLSKTLLQPTAEDQALLMCAHGAKHCWSSLDWIVDVASLTRVPSTRLDWGRALDRARQVGGERQLLLGLWLAREVVGARLPVEVDRRVGADRTVTSLGTALRARIFMPPAPHSQGNFRLIEGGIAYIKSRERLKDKLHCAVHLLLHRFGWIPAAVMPNEHDRAVVRLPRALAFLYFAIRPARLIVDKVRRLGAGWRTHNSDRIGYGRR